MTTYTASLRASLAQFKSKKLQRPKRLRALPRAVSRRYDLRCAATTIFDPTASRSIRPGAFHCPHYFCDSSSAPLLVSTRLERAHTHPRAATPPERLGTPPTRITKAIVVLANTSEVFPASSSVCHTGSRTICRVQSALGRSRLHHLLSNSLGEPFHS